MLGTSIILDKKKPAPPVKLSLVALMDIFTILVFFLLLNSGDSQTLEDAKFVKLPDSSSNISPHSELTIHVGTDELWMEDQKISDIADIAVDKNTPIEPLAVALADMALRFGELNQHANASGLPVTIMADRDVPYAVLRAVMATLSSENFRDISLAVNRVAGPTYGNAAPGTGAQAVDGGPSP